MFSLVFGKHRSDTVPLQYGNIVTRSKKTDVNYHNATQ